MAHTTWMQPKLDWLPTDDYNFEDLNRVENNTEYVSELISYHVVLPPFTFVQNRNMQHIEFADSLNRIESVQDALRQRFTPSGWIENKTNWAANDPFSYVDARRLESNVNLLYLFYKGNTDMMPHCGATICGEATI